MEPEHAAALAAAQGGCGAKAFPIIYAGAYGVSTGNTETQNRAALNDAIAAAKDIAGGLGHPVIIQFGYGTYAIAGTFDLGADGRSIGFRGAGIFGTRLNMTSTVPDVPTWNFDYSAASDFGDSAMIYVGDLSIYDYVPRACCRTVLSSTIRFKNPSTIVLNDLYINSTGGKGLCIDGVNNLLKSGVQIESTTSTAFEMLATDPSRTTSMRVSASSYRLLGTGGTTATYGAAVHLSGTSTSVVWAGNKIGGAGPRFLAPVTSITSGASGFDIEFDHSPVAGRTISSINHTPSYFEVLTTFPHRYSAGDQVVLHGNSPEAYDGLFTIASATEKSFRVTTASDYGVATALGTAFWPPFTVDDQIILQGMTPEGYNGLWTVASIVDWHTVRIASTANLGTATGTGFASSPFVGLLIDNEMGPMNEGTWGDTIIEATNIETDKKINGSYALMFDGSRSNTSTLYSHGVSNFKLDQGHGNIYIRGNRIVDGSRAPETLNFAGLRCVSPGDSITLQGHCGSLTFSQIQSVPQPTIDRDAFEGAAAVRLKAAFKGAPRGVTITASHIGTPNGFDTAQGEGFFYGIVVDGDGCQDVSIKGGVLYGKISPLSAINGATLAGIRMDVDVPLMFASDWPGLTIPTNNTDMAPNVPVTGSTLFLPPQAMLNLGASSVQTVTTIDGGWPGRRVVIFVGGPTLTFATGGNIAVGMTMANGTWAELVFNGQRWFMR